MQAGEMRGMCSEASRAGAGNAHCPRLPLPRAEPAEREPAPALR